MSDKHFIEQCKKCSKVVSQCRCPAKDKTIVPVVCSECKKKDTE